MFSIGNGKGGRKEVRVIEGSREYYADFVASQGLEIGFGKIR